jgi:hypothetical protein
MQRVKSPRKSLLRREATPCAESLPSVKPTREQTGTVYQWVAVAANLQSSVAAVTAEQFLDLKAFEIHSNP